MDAVPAELSRLFITIDCIRRMRERVSPVELLLLVTLAASVCDGSVRGCAKSLGLRKPTVSQSLRRLGAYQYVNYVRGKRLEDLRIEITARGRAFIAEVSASAEQSISDWLSHPKDFR